MKDWNQALRKSYIKILKVNKPAFYEMIPDTSAAVSSYFLIHTIVGVEDSDKNSFDGKVSIMVDIIANSVDAALNITAVESMAAFCKNAINAKKCPDLSPDFHCITTKIILDQQFNNITNTQKVIRRLLRYEHLIEELGLRN